MTYGDVSYGDETYGDVPSLYLAKNVKGFETVKNISRLQRLFPQAKKLLFMLGAVATSVFLTRRPTLPQKQFLM
jgi:hypothetical protein